jgi:hypothetical protein
MILLRPSWFSKDWSATGAMTYAGFSDAMRSASAR